MRKPKPCDFEAYRLKTFEERSIAEIAVAQNVTVQTVYNRIKRAAKKIEGDTPDARSLRHKLDCERLEFAYCEAMRAWRRSQEPVETTRVSTADGKRKAEKVEQSQTGDVRYLQQAQKIMADLTELRRTGSTETHPSSRENAETHVQTLGLDQRAAELDRILAEALERKSEAAADRTDRGAAD